MSRPIIQPQVVGATDRRLRRRAAGTAFLAWLTAPSTLALVTVAALPGGVILWHAFRPLGVLWASLAGAGFYVLAVLIVATADALNVYWTPRRREGRLCFTSDARGMAAIPLRPDRRRGALPGDVQGFCASAWPKGRGVGLELGKWSRALVHAEGGRVTLTATPVLAWMYRRHGFVDDGRTARFLIRLASRPRAHG